MTYTGRWRDEETSSYDYRARSYDAAVGTFLQRDPLSYDVGPSLYQYVLSNPIRYTDPLGLVNCEECAKKMNKSPTFPNFNPISPPSDKRRNVTFHDQPEYNDAKSCGWGAQFPSPVGSTGCTWQIVSVTQYLCVYKAHGMTPAKCKRKSSDAQQAWHADAGGNPAGVLPSGHLGDSPGGGISPEGARADMLELIEQAKNSGIPLASPAKMVFVHCHQSQTYVFGEDCTLQAYYEWFMVFERILGASKSRPEVGFPKSERGKAPFTGNGPLSGEAKLLCGCCAAASR